MLDLAKRFAGCPHRDDALTGSQCGVGIVSSIAMPRVAAPFCNNSTAVGDVDAQVRAGAVIKVPLMALVLVQIVLICHVLMMQIVPQGCARTRTEIGTWCDALSLFRRISEPLAGLGLSRHV